MAIVLNRQKAVEYAQKYWDEESGNYNKLFPHFDGNDCTNFVSQCWHEGGGIDMSPLVWTGGSTTIVTTDAWVNVDAFAKYMTELSAGYDNLPIAVMKCLLEILFNFIMKNVVDGIILLLSHILILYMVCVIQLILILCIISH